MQKIIIVDDNPLMRSTLVSILEMKGFDVTSCENGARGLAAIRSQVFDAAIVDIFMPDEDGIGFVVQARAQGFAAPIIAVSGGGGNVDYLSMALKLGADAALPKPFRPREILDVLRREIDRAAASHE